MAVWGRVLIALVVPVAWGLVSAWFFDWLRLRRGRSAPDKVTANACSETEPGPKKPL